MDQSSHGDATTTANWRFRPPRATSRPSGQANPCTGRYGPTETVCGQGDGNADGHAQSPPGLDESHPSREETTIRFALRAEARSLLGAEHIRAGGNSADSTGIAAINTTYDHNLALRVECDIVAWGRELTAAKHGVRLCADAVAIAGRQLSQRGPIRGSARRCIARRSAAHRRDGRPPCCSTCRPWARAADYKCNGNGVESPATKASPFGNGHRLATTDEFRCIATGPLGASHGHSVLVQTVPLRVNARPRIRHHPWASAAATTSPAHPRSTTMARGDKPIPDAQAAFYYRDGSDPPSTVR
jgi:hypothetical protein